MDEFGSKCKGMNLIFEDIVRYRTKNSLSSFGMCHCALCIQIGGTDCQTQVHGWSEKFSALTIDGNTIGKIFFLSWYICHKHPCEIASHSIK